MNKKLQLTLLAGAVALAVAGQANATIVTGSSTVGSDLVLSVVDSTTGLSFVEDLGVTAATFTAGVTGTTAATVAAASPYAAGNTTLGSAADATALSSFLGTLAATDAVTWNVSASMSGAAGGFGTTNILTTSNSGLTSFTALSNTVLKGTAVSATAYFGLASGLTGTADYVSGATAAALSPAGGVPTPLIDPAVYGSSSMAAVGTSMNFLFLTPSSTSTIAKAAGAVFGNANGTDTFTLASNGVLTYAVAGAVAAVPEPGEWLLMLSGFGLLGFIASRRKNQNAPMMFA